MTTKKQIKFKRQTLITALLIGAVLLSGCIWQTPQTQKVYHVGIISGLDVFAGMADGFKSRMTELGHIEGNSIVYDVQKLNSDPAGEERVVKKFVDDKVDLIFAFPTEPALAAKAATQGTNIPVVFAHAGLEGSGLVESVGHPGGNITGTRFPGPDLTLNRFELLLELKPGIKRLYMIYDKNYPNCVPALQALRPVASSRGVTLVESPITSLEEIKTELEMQNKSANNSIDAILLLPEQLTQSPDAWAMISRFAAQHKLPLVGSSAATADNGGVFSYNVDPLETGKLAGSIADKILKGTPAGTIMVVTPPSYLRLNFKRAQELKLNVSEGLLARASEIIR